MTSGPKLFGMALWISLFVLACSYNIKADTVVTFTVGTGGNFGPVYTENGFSFTSPNVLIEFNELNVTTFNLATPIVITFQGGAFDFLEFRYVFAGGFSGTTFTASNGASFTPTFPGVTYTLGPEFRNITSLTLTHFNAVPPEGPTYNVYDNFRFQSPGTSAVPEPATIFLFGMGLASARTLARRQRKNRIQ